MFGAVAILSVPSKLAVASVAVLHARPDDVADGGDLVGNGSVGAAVLRREVQVAVGVHAAGERERGAGEEREIHVRERAELKHRVGNRLHLAGQVRFAAGRRARHSVERVRFFSAISPWYGPLAIAALQVAISVVGQGISVGVTP